MSDAPLPTAHEAAMRRIAEVKAQLAAAPPKPDPSVPASPLHLIPDLATRAKETTRQAFERIARYLEPQVLTRLRALSQHARAQIVTRIVHAERKKETLATATPTPSPKQRRALALREGAEVAEQASGASVAVQGCTAEGEASQDQQLTEESRT